jgi:AcrR family transcriptional regulator
MDGLRERKRAHNRAATVDVALALFAEHGYDKVTVADICAAAEIAPRTFFRYFATKDDLLVEPVREMSALLAAAIAAAPAGAPDGEVLRGALRQVGGYVVANRRRLDTFVRVARAASVLRGSPLVVLSDREREVAAQLIARRTVPPNVPGTADWRMRLLVARTMAAYRIWFEDVLAAELADPLGHLDEVFGCGEGTA